MGRRHVPNPVKLRSRPIATMVALLFVAAGAVWSVTTDLLIYHFAEDPVLVGRIETAKGWLFVTIAAAFLYWLVDRAVRRLARSDATLHAVVDSISDGVFVVGADRNILSANPAAARMLGERRPEELIGIGPEEFTRRFNLMSPDGHLLAPDDLNSLRALKGDQQPPNKVVIAPNGSAVLVAMVTASPVRPLPDGPVELAVSVMHDVTAFEQLHNAREQFVASAAHSLRTPVAIIKAHLHLLAMSGIELPPTTVQVIERQCGKIVRLTENLIVLARISTDSLRLHPQPVSCAELVEEVARDMKEASADHGLINQVDGEPVILADRDRLGLAVRNLIELAYRRSRPRTNVTIMVSKIEAKARICVTYEPLVDGEQLGRDDGDGFSGLGLEQHVIESLASASRGTMGSEDRDRTQHKDWLEFPTMVELSHV